MNNQLPKGWVKPSIGEVCDLNPKINKSLIDDNRDVHFVPMPAVEALSNRMNVSDIRKFASVKKGYTPFCSNDVLFAKITPCMENGKMVVVPELSNGIAFGSTEFHVLRTLGGVSPVLIFYFVSSRAYRAEAERNMTGAVGQRRVPIDFIRKSDFPLSPLNEQRRIVAKIEELFSEIDAGVASLKTARAQLGVYRQSLLKQAFEGKLTEKWRTQNPDQLEPAEQLLARIRNEREARYLQQLTDWQTAVQEWEAGGKEGKKPSKPKKPREVELFSEDELAKLSKLPLGLCWVKFGALIDDPAYGTSKKCSYDSEGRGVLRIPNLVEGIIDDGDLKFASFTEEEEKNYQLIDGDLLLIRSNGSVSIVGRCVRVSQKHTKHLYAGYLIRMRPMHRVTDSDFIRMQLSSSALRNQIESFAKSTSGVNNINAKEIQALVLSVCSLPEQQEIVRILEEQFTAIEQNEAEIEAALQRAEALRQSILKKAFAGKLVPQDPNDEPASVLLERIRAEREAAEAAKKPTKKKVAKKRKGTNHK